MINPDGQLLVCIDDTDELHGIGTGKLAHRLGVRIKDAGMGECGFITRHQLFVHPDIPYTSHNSAMCFTARLNSASVGKLVELASEFLSNFAAEGSDPGLCILDPSRSDGLEMLVEFGGRAKREVLTKEDAYRLADETGVYLSEHGGTGGGVIGALAGVGLRLSGSDGRLRGRLKLGERGVVMSVGEILKAGPVDTVMTLTGRRLGDTERVMLGEKVKGIYTGGSPVLPVSEHEGGVWHTCTKEELRVF